MRRTNVVGVGLAAVVIGLCAGGLRANPFAPGDLVVYRVGDGTTLYGGNGGTSGSVAAPVFLDEYTGGGVLVQSIPMPTVTSGANRRLVSSATATSEGWMSLSTDGRYLVATGFDAAMGSAGVASTANSGATPVNRVIGRIGLDGTVDTTTALTDAYDGGDIRGVASPDGSVFYTSGTAGSGKIATAGMRYVNGLGASTSTIVSTTTNTRAAGVFLGRLYFSTGSTPTGTKTLTDLLPTSATGQTENQVAASASPYAFVLLDMNGNGSLDNGDRLYIADDNGGSGGLLRSTFDGTAWGTASVLVSSATLGGGLRGLTGYVDASGNAVLYGTSLTANIVTSASTSSFTTNLLTLTDTGTPAFTTLATFTGTNAGNTGVGVPLEGFRGVALIPGATPVPEPASLGLLALAGVVLLGRRRK